MSNQYIDKSDVQQNKGMGMLVAIIPVLFFVPLVSGGANKSPFLKFMANQGLVFTVTCIVLSVIMKIVGAVLGIIPFLGWSLSTIIGAVVGLVQFILWLMMVISVINNEPKKYFVIGEIELIK
ncbi:MAG: DUF4870 domain-containing protein [Oscillospiraceae bacterium]|nr:DUF4870 domain-containing protein [Oscillospiraceae bacterium]